MNCPVCKKDSFVSEEIEPNLTVAVCTGCNGRWISNESYQNWLKHCGRTLREIPADQLPPLTIPKFELARICPVDRRILIKYKVGRNLPFTIDRCGACAGVWLEDTEWETLKSRNLHEEINKIFTDRWQEEVMRETTRNHLRSIYEEKFGVENYAKILDFKKWMETQEKADEISAYIRDKNPLQF